MTKITVSQLKETYAKGVRDFEAVELENADLVMANLYGINLSRAYLSGTDLYGAILRKSYLIEANLQGVSLIKANLYGADLSGASLRDANLTGAQMKNANLYGTWMKGVDLSGAMNITRIENCAEDGGSLIAVRWDNAIMFQRGCFWGTEEKMVSFLTNREKVGWSGKGEKKTLKYWQVLMDACKLAMPAE